MLPKSEPLSKPWITEKDRTGRIAYFITYGVMFLGITASAVRCYLGWTSVPIIGKTSLVLDEQFSGTQIGTESTWLHEVNLGYARRFLCLFEADGIHAGTASLR